MTLAVTTFLAATSAHALPSYARQTGQDCAACHIGAYGPQLTPFGIKFKLGGYVDSDGKDGKIPLSAMVVADYSRYKNDAGDTTTKTGLSEASIFLAGKLTDQIGSFVQVTHDGTEHHTSIDQVDVRYANNLTVSGNEALVGVSVNNNPTVQDPFNTLPVWGFPYTSSPYSNAIGAEFQGLGNVEHRVLGVNAYTLLNNSVYGELGLYNTLSPSIQSRQGLGKADGQDLGRLNNAPYWRVGYMQDLRSSAWSVGMMGFDGSLKDRQSGDLITKFKDFGVDASYQYLGNRKHIATVNASYIRERTTDGSDVRNTQKDMRISTSYHYLNTYGATVGLFKGTSADQTAGNRGLIYQVDWTPWGKESSWNAPWANLRVGLQYIAYKRYVEGSTDEISGITTYAPLNKPSDKNTLSLFAWTSF
ncbi:MAG: hypothetical protein KGL57_02090 [Burkholderiales bacterium]|nr:hypothetical protein [Burkholderiales bacterium]